MEVSVASTSADASSHPFHSVWERKRERQKIIIINSRVMDCRWSFVLSFSISKAVIIFIHSDETLFAPFLYACIIHQSSYLFTHAISNICVVFFHPMSLGIWPLICQSSFQFFEPLHIFNALFGHVEIIFIVV